MFHREKTATCLSALLLPAVASASCASQAPPTAGPPTRSITNDFGVLVMAHGGPVQWNRAVLSAVEPLKDRYNIEVAFGMADAATLQDGVRKLEDDGARRIGVVRLFISGESFLDRTEQILGIKPGAPPPPESSSIEQAGPTSHNHENMPFWKLQTHAAFTLSAEGLLDAPEMGTVWPSAPKRSAKNPRWRTCLFSRTVPETMQKTRAGSQSSTHEPRSCDNLSPSIRCRQRLCAKIGPKSVQRQSSAFARLCKMRPSKAALRSSFPSACRDLARMPGFSMVYATNRTATGSYLILR